MSTDDTRAGSASAPTDFIREAVAEDTKAGRFGGRVWTRFPPEPNAYLHIGHAKALLLNWNISQEFGGGFNLRFDDTNPAKEEQEYVDQIKEDLKWLGADWETREFYASDYFEQLYEWAVVLIKKGKTFVCDLSADEVSATRGTLTSPGKESPWRNRSVEENLDLFTRMRTGEFPDGARTLRAKIDMASPNMNMRDPVMYRILHTPHHHVGDKWCIYPMYDWAHGQCDSIERITHSLCSLEYENHRPLYDWFLDELGIWHPRQMEFARLNLTYTVLSKRRLLKIHNELGIAWDDPRMPTLAAIRRRGYTREAIVAFVRAIGIDKKESTADIQLLEHCVREDLNKRAPRAMAVLKPLKLVIDNYEEGRFEWMEAVNNPEDASAGTRKVPFSRVLYIEQDDFREVPPPKYYRLYPGQEVRLRYAYFVKCTGVVKDAAGNITEVHCTYDPATRGGDSPDGRRVKSTIHWVSAEHSESAEVRLYDRLFTKENPIDVPEGVDWLTNVNPNSLEVVSDARVEPALAEAAIGSRWQFERLGYFSVDADTKGERIVFNRIVTLKDTWAKIEKAEKSRLKTEG